MPPCVHQERKQHPGSGRPCLEGISKGFTEETDSAEGGEGVGGRGLQICRNDEQRENRRAETRAAEVRGAEGEPQEMGLEIEAVTAQKGPLPCASRSRNRGSY